MSDFEDDETSVSEASFLLKVLQINPFAELPRIGEKLEGNEGHRYEVLKHLGGGGMGHVFLSWDEVLWRQVALKFLLADPGRDEEVLREARAVARLDHDHIVHIFDVARWRRSPGMQHIPFLVMEALKGESLAALLKRGPLEVRHALELLESIALGLAHAHACGLVHRDLKPDNVFLTRQGKVKLLDFGLSHVMAATTPQAPFLPLAGTPAYMAPEQWRGAPQDARVDVWAAGVVLYEMLTGHVPYPRARLGELRAQVLSGESMPSVRLRVPEVPEEVQTLLKRALAKAPDRRFPSARELLRELGELRARLEGPLREAASLASVPQLRQLTLICCQLTWRDGLAERLDPDDLREVVAAFHEGCEELIGRYGGTITSSMGAEVFACVGCRQVREIDTERSVHAALRLAHDVPGMIQRSLPHVSLSGLATRVGLHTDLMVGLETGALQAEAAKVAAWLASQAGPGEVWIGRTTRKLVQGAFELEPLGARLFEGQGLTGSECMERHRVVCERKAEVRFDRALATRGVTPLVGRKRELRRLLTLWERARGGQGALVLVCGEAGIGKSRLLRELLERVPPESATRLRLQCWSPLSANTLHPTVALLQGLIRSSPRSPPLLQRRKLEERLGALGLPEESVALLGLLLGLPLPEGSSLLQLTPARRREKTHEALVELLLRLARQRPMLILVEDLHWSDSSWLEFLGILMERIGGARLLIALSTRPELQPDWSNRPWFHKLPLRRLPTRLAATLVREAANGASLSEKAVRELVGRTDGMPLFIEEMTHMVLEQSASGALEPGGLPGSIPVTLHELLQARLDMRPSRQKALAQLGAILGRDFSSALLAAVSGHDAAELRHELAGLVEAGLFQEERAETGESGYRFRHALFQEAAYQSLPRGERRLHHSRIAQVLEEHFPTLVEARPELLAHHHTEAGQHTRAVPCWRKAGMLALNRRAIPEALKHLSQALELLRRLPGSHLHPGEELQVLTALGFAQAELQGFDSPVAARTYARAWALLRRMNEVTPLLGASFWEIFVYHLERLELALCREVARHVITQAERQQDPELLSMGQLMRAVVFTYQGRVRSALESSERAMGRARFSLKQHRELVVRHRRGSPTEALAYLSCIHSLAGRLEQAREHGRDALKLARRVGEPVTLAGVLTYTALACLIRRDLQDASRWAEEFIAISRERGDLLRQAWACVIRGRVLADQGQPKQALAIVQRLTAYWWDQRSHAGLTYCFCMIAELHLMLGQVRQGLTAVHKALDLVRRTGERICEAELHRVRGELLRIWGLEHRAKHEFFRAIAIAREQGTLLFELRATVCLARLLRDLGRQEPARQLLVRILERFEPDVDSADLGEARALLARLVHGDPCHVPPGS
ncbi:putative ATPase [Archangium gephyra]|uniref:ATPase n=1 Tax=Archangium gephyra TaxID=48 RepID=A0AAC8QCV9_9BACT|nr:protein kinase [Archangium gephyra]AKJ04761.1 Adenylate cyclase [Archangium gephyra]REG37186.1 putative ATPase [Archangium gephyra]